MASTPHDPNETITTSTDFAAHQHTYDAFVRGVKWAIGILVVVMIAMFFIINP